MMSAQRIVIDISITIKSPYTNIYQFIYLFL